ncbi:hypothetical protein FJZ19_05025 [Candidatus Pacearchaeota archaeon]|nr:hypothetical protein [Candidatus Pacearchaeota archaeon]
MIIELMILTETGKGNIDRARKVLAGMGLVPARISYCNPNSALDDSVMVWEDPKEHIGRYRVHLREASHKGKKYDAIYFHYWTNIRSLEKEIFEQEPLDLAVQNVLPVLEGISGIKCDSTLILPREDAIRKFFPVLR